MKRIAVMGLGNFGTALARNWILAGHDVRGWTVEQEVYDSISSVGNNEKYLSDVSLSGMEVSMDPTEIISGAEIVVLALPSGVVLSVVDDLLPYLTDHQILLDLAKGLVVAPRVQNQIYRQRINEAT